MNFKEVFTKAVKSGNVTMTVTEDMLPLLFGNDIDVEETVSKTITKPVKTEKKETTSDVNKTNVPVDIPIHTCEEYHSWSAREVENYAKKYFNIPRPGSKTDKIKLICEKAGIEYVDAPKAKGGTAKEAPAEITNEYPNVPQDLQVMNIFQLKKAAFEITGEKLERKATKPDVLQLLDDYYASEGVTTKTTAKTEKKAKPAKSKEMPPAFYKWQECVEQGLIEKTDKSQQGKPEKYYDEMLAEATEEPEDDEMSKWDTSSWTD